VQLDAKLNGHWKCLLPEAQPVHPKDQPILSRLLDLILLGLGQDHILPTLSPSKHDVPKSGSLAADIIDTRIHLLVAKFTYRAVFVDHKQKLLVFEPILLGRRKLQIVGQGLVRFWQGEPTTQSTIPYAKTLPKVFPGGKGGNSIVSRWIGNRRSLDPTNCVHQVKPGPGDRLALRISNFSDQLSGFRLGKTNAHLQPKHSGEESTSPSRVFFIPVFHADLHTEVWNQGFLQKSWKTKSVLAGSIAPQQGGRKLTWK